MANETVAPPTDQRDSKSVASNIVDGIKNKSSGKAPEGKAPEGKAPETPPNPNAGKEKYNVEGKDIWLTPDQARAYVQKGIAFEPRVDQLARLQTEMGAFLQTLKEDPIRILTDQRIGLTPEIVLEKVLKSDKISEEIKESVGRWYYDNVIAPMKLSPEERRAAELEKENAQYKSKEQIQADNAIKQENYLRVQQAMSTIKAQIGEAMKESGLPNNDVPLGALMARRVADIMRLAYFQRQSVTPKDAITRVKNELKQVQTAYYDHLDGEQLVKEIGEVNAEKVKKYFLKVVKDAEKQIPGNQKPSPILRNGERKTTSLDEFHDYLDELKKKG